MITYNHELYIAQAIEGVLKQKAYFSIELVIGEDFSSDKTREICLSYKEKFPNKIRILQRDKNLGMMNNFVDSLKSCEGKYVALCEGDDYWTDPLKLQKQIDFLESNPEFSACCHRVQVIDQDGCSISNSFDIEQKIMTFEDLVVLNSIYTASFVYRNKQFEVPDWFNKVSAGDLPLYLLNAKIGKVKFFNEIMGAYRKHSGGVWSPIGAIERTSKLISLLLECQKHFYPHAKALFSQQIAIHFKRLLPYYFVNSKYQDYRDCYSRCFPFARYFKGKVFFRFTFWYLLSFFPAVAIQYKHLRKNV